MIALLSLCSCWTCALAVPTVTTQGDRYVVAGESYWAIFRPETMSFNLELRLPDGRPHLVGSRSSATTLALFAEGRELDMRGIRATWAAQIEREFVHIAQQAVVSTFRDVIVEVNYLCTDEGVLVGAKVSPPTNAILWCPPRIALPPEQWDGYAFWDESGRLHEGSMLALGAEPTYAGVSPWGQTGDTVPTLDADHPALIVRSEALRLALAVVYVDLTDRWAGAHMFVQRHTPQAQFLYAAYAPCSDVVRWAWLAPAPLDNQAAWVERMVRAGQALVTRFAPIARSVPPEWKQPVPEFPAHLRRVEPVRSIAEAVVYSVNEYTYDEYGVQLAGKVGSDVLIRGWFKWGQAPPVDRQKDVVPKVHAQGALFGGGITCSALYDGENGLTEAEWKDLATRGPAGQLIDAWNQPGIRHGTLSNPAYLDYLFRWCREQMDAGVDYLFMDEHTAALGELEGYDDYSLADFREYLLLHAPQTQGWGADDARWHDFGIDLADPDLCPDGTMRSFDYRAFLRKRNLLERPTAGDNPLAPLWWQFRVFRDDRAWKTLTDRIRAYAAQHGRTVYISANGLAKYVDLQVLGVWGHFRVRDGHIDLSESQIPIWRATVLRGHELAGRPVPVVFFHDWGFGDPPFPWLALLPSERELWIRTRGAEIYAAGAFFAFPVLGPFGCDAAADGTLREIARQTTFYQTHRDLYLEAEYVGTQTLRSQAPNLSLAAWWCPRDNTLLLHVINRQLREGTLEPREGLTVDVPVAPLPVSAVAVSPDWPGERPVRCEKRNGVVSVSLPLLEAYLVARLSYADRIPLDNLRDPARIVLTPLWARPLRNEFVVRPDRYVENSGDLNGFIQGQLHTHLRNPPTFLVNARSAGRVLVMVQAVARGGATLDYLVDGEPRQSVDLPDLDGKNDGSAAEYGRVMTFDIPPGRHRLTLDNTGADWCVISWLEFQGEFEEW